MPTTKTLDDVIDHINLLSSSGDMARTENASAVRGVLRAALDADRARLARIRQAETESALHDSLANLAALTGVSFAAQLPADLTEADWKALGAPDDFFPKEAPTAAATPDTPDPDPDDLVGSMWATGQKQINDGLLSALAAGRTYSEVKQHLLASLDACWKTGGASALVPPPRRRW